MPIFELFFRKHREIKTLGVLVLLSLSLLLLPQQTKLDVARSVLNAVFLPVERFWHFVESYREVDEENRRLKRIVASLMLEREKLIQFRSEHDRLRKLADFKEEQFLKLTPCEVIGRNLDRFQTILVIDKGEEDSIRIRMPVLSYQGYAGRVLKVFKKSAWVELVCSRNHPVSCLSKRSRVVGILEWRDHDYFEMKNVGAVEDVQVGDTLITSGFGGVVPKGFPVAVVSKVTRSIDGISLRIDAKSQVNFRSLEEIFVVTQEIPWDRAVLYDHRDSGLIEKISREKP